MKTLYPIQAAHVDRLEAIIRSQKSALDSSETGCGKTVCAAEIALRLKAPSILVVCPKAVIPSWRKELDDRGVLNADVINYEKLRTGKTKYAAWEKVFRRETFKWKLPKYSLVIFDEAHRCGGETSQNAEMLIEARHDTYYLLMLSATLASSPVHLRAAGYALGFHGLQNYRGWAKSHGCTLNQFQKLEYRGSSAGLEKLGQSMRHVTSRLTVADMADHFTETQINSEPLEFDTKINSCYSEMEEELQVLADRSKHDKVGAAAEKLVVQLRARQKIELLKVPVIVELVKDALDEGKSVAVFVNFHQTIEALQSKFKDSEAIHGQQTGDQRQTAIHKFQTDETRIVICNTAAGGVGVSLHDVTGKHPRLAIISPDWNEKTVVQTLGRVHRAGGKTPSQQRILFAAGTVEEEVEASLRRKINNLKTINKNSMIEYVEDSEVPVVKAPNAVLSLGPEGMKLEVQPQQITCEPTVPAPFPEKPPVPVAKCQATDLKCQATDLKCQATDLKCQATDLKSETPDHSARGHAEHSPSSLKYFEACPSFKKTDGSSAMAEIGTKIHEALDAEDFSRLLPEELPIAEFCIKFRDHVRAGKRPAPLLKQYKEIRLTVALGETLSTYGSVDLFEVYGDGTAVLMDWKTGYNAVDDCEINSQVWAYTLGAFQKFPDVNTIDTYLVLPRRQEISHFEFKRADVERMALRLGTIILRARELNGTTFTPQEGVCDYCGNRAKCQALADRALKLGKASNFDVPETVDVVNGTGADKAKLLKLANLLTSWADDVKKELLRQALEEGAELPGYRLDQRRVPRSIPSPVVAYNALKDVLSLEEFLAAAGKVSITSLEEAYAEKAPRGKKASYKADLNDRLLDAGALSQDGIIHILKAVKA